MIMTARIGTKPKKTEFLASSVSAWANRDGAALTTPDTWSPAPRWNNLPAGETPPPARDWSGGGVLSKGTHPWSTKKISAQAWKSLSRTTKAPDRGSRNPGRYPKARRDESPDARARSTVAVAKSIGLPAPPSERNLSMSTEPVRSKGMLGSNSRSLERYPTMSCALSKSLAAPLVII